MASGPQCNKNNKKIVKQQTSSCSSSSSSNSRSWRERLLGEQLVRCEKNDSIEKLEDIVKDEKNFIVATKDAIRDNCEVIGLYFSFVDDNVQGSHDDFTRRLLELYRSLNDKENHDRLEIIQIVLWNGLVHQHPVDVDHSFRTQLCDLPWLAMPYKNYDKTV